MAFGPWLDLKWTSHSFLLTYYWHRLASSFPSLTQEFAGLLAYVPSTLSLLN